jgi:hypothetical protein
MFNNDKLLFSAKNEVSAVKNIVNEYEDYLKNGDDGKAKQQFQIIAKIMKERTEERYVKPINMFLHNCREHPEQSGFIVMVINCILLELYFEMTNGFDTSDENGCKVKDAYTTILPLLDSNITPDTATKFYKGIRCKIIHQGQTGEHTAITFDSLINDIITQNGGYYLCNPKVLFDKLCSLYKEYWKELSEGRNITQKINFIKKFKYILYHDD